eukprot:TRINITY_DN23068_c0_g1_i4.p1 TRINITY_DN23068_c0_g1~~TRINITY_DN23068_c0_g1_i4.p1  ORF type:complete len:231 (+),score=61.25 TRINITY_DN23068_c0_g1_i4:561-1253(+)
MKKRDELRYRRATAVRTFGQERSADFLAGAKAANLFATLSTQLTNLTTAMAEQLPARIDKKPLLEKLLADCRKIARTARAIAIEADDASFATPYRLPEKLNETPLLTHADTLRALLQDQPGDSAQTQQSKFTLRNRFTAYELPADFIETLTQRADTLRNASRTNQGENQEGVENTMLIGRILDNTGQTIRQLDAIMVNKYATEPEKLRAWNTASRVEKLPRKAKVAPATS